METLTREEYLQKLADLQSARQNNTDRKANFTSSKVKPIIKRNWFQIILDFLTH